MIEILDRLDLLARPRLDLHTLCLAGVPYGSAAGSIPRHRIVEVTGSPMVRRTVAGEHPGPEYYDADDRRLPSTLVVESVLEASGVVHFADHLSFTVAGGAVVGFALYGADRGPLKHFSYLTGYQQFLETFGAPDRVEVSGTPGDLRGYRVTYLAAGKSVCWDAWVGRLSRIDLAGRTAQP